METSAALFLSLNSMFADDVQLQSEGARKGVFPPFMRTGDRRNFLSPGLCLVNEVC